MRDMYQKLLYVRVCGKVCLVYFCQTLPAEILLFFTPFASRKSTWKNRGRLFSQSQTQKIFMYLSASTVIFKTFSVFDAMYYMRPFSLHRFIINSSCLSTHLCLNPFQINSFRVDKMEFSTLPDRIRQFNLSKHYPLKNTHCLLLMKAVLPGKSCNRVEC